MSLQFDSLVTDLMFQVSAAIDQKTLIDGLGGQEALEGKQILDVDRLDPRAEMEMSPSIPFRRRGERRLMIIDDQAITPRPDPQAEKSTGPSRTSKRQRSWRQRSRSTRQSRSDLPQTTKWRNHHRPRDSDRMGLRRAKIDAGHLYAFCSSRRIPPIKRAWR